MNKSPFRKRYPLLSGDQVTVRTLSAFDFVGEGAIPLITKPQEEEIKALQEGEDRQVDPVKDAPNVKRLGLLLEKGIIAYHAREQNEDLKVDGELPFHDFKVVNKDPRDCGEGEISIVEIHDNVQAEIVIMINRAAGVPDMSTFPGKRETNGDPGGDGESVGDGPLDTPPDEPGQV